MPWIPKKRLVVPVDFSENSFAAVRLARSEFVDHAEALHILHVLPDLPPTEPGVIWDTVDDASRRTHAEIALRKELSDADLADANFQIEFGGLFHSCNRCFK